MKGVLETHPISAACVLLFSAAQIYARAHVTPTPVLNVRYIAATAVNVPLLCMFGFRGHPCRPCRRRHS